MKSILCNIPLPGLPCHTYGDMSKTYDAEDVLVQDVLQRRKERAKNPVKSHHRKTARAAKENLLHMSRYFGPKQCASLTLTCRPGTTPKKARALFVKLTPVLDSLFPAWLVTLDVDSKGRPHLHGLTALRFDIRDGFDCDNYLQMRAISKDLTSGHPASSGSTPVMIMNRVIDRIVFLLSCSGLWLQQKSRPR